ncbi:IS3 family transposase [Mycoplasmatota bacterium zrk1]
MKGAFIMRYTLKEKLKMCIEHVEEHKSLSHVSERHNNYDLSSLKYLVALYMTYGEKPFIQRKIRSYRRDTKLLAIGRVETGESIRSVALDFELIDPSILGDWVKIYRTKGEEAIKDTHSRRAYMSEEERNKYKVDKALKEENERLRAEIEYLKKSQSLIQKLKKVTNRDKAAIVTELRKDFSLKVLLDVTAMASSVYYYNVNKLKENKDNYIEIKEEIDYLYLIKHKKRMGYQRIYIELQKLGYRIGKNKVLEIMREKGYLKKKAKKWRKYNSYEGIVGKLFPNEMNQEFTTSRPYEKAGTDITMFPMEEESVYLSPVIDFHSREVLSYTVGTNAKMDKIDSMMKELKANHSVRVKGMIIQSDQGVQYQNSRYREMVEDLGMKQSMSRKGNCLDNSPTENFFGRMKEEMWNGCREQYKDANELMSTIHEYIDYYNTTRIVTRHKMSPVNYRNEYFKEVNMVGG